MDGIWGYVLMLQLVLETLETCEEYVPRLITATKDIAYHLQSGNEAAGIGLLEPVFEGIGWVIDAVHGIQQNRYPLDIQVTEMQEVLKSLEEALEMRDYVLMADLFEYEIAPLLENWLEQIHTSYQQLKVV